MSNSIDWENFLKEKGIRVTRQRIAILEVLDNSSKPISARGIFDELAAKYPSIRLSTIYRNLNHFTAKNMVKMMELNIEKKESYFELKNRGHHHHMICLECGEILPLECPLKDYLFELSSETGYKIIDHRVKLYGLCPACSKEEW
ncbi:MAG: transcriptional repressor [Firmicutes bacterium]|nr:transcriptional repressor [Bacillota bacterium]